MNDRGHGTGESQPNKVYFLRASGWLSRFRDAILCGLLALTSAAMTAAVPKLPVSAFFALPKILEPRLSPNGRYIAFLFPDDGRMAIGLFDRKTNKARSVMRATDESIGYFTWKGNDRLVFAADVDGNRSPFIGSCDLNGRHVLRFVESQRIKYNLVGSAGSFVSTLPLDPDYIVLRGAFMNGNLDNAVMFNVDETVDRINVKNGGRSTLFTPDRDTYYRDFECDNNGVLKIIAEVNGTEVVWSCRNDEHDDFKEFARYPFHGYAPTLEPLGFAADNKTLYVISRKDHDRGALYTFDTATRRFSKAIFIPPAGEIIDIVQSYDRSKLYGVVYETDRIHYAWIDKARANLQRRLDAGFPGSDCAIVSTSANEKVDLVRVSSDRNPGDYYVLDLKHGNLAPFKKITDLNPNDMRPMEPIAFKARDGLLLHGYLTLPAGKPGAHGFPLVIYPHGGPFGIRDDWGFNPDVQLLANRGYAVLQVNYRGSGGYGRSFINKGRYQWGRAMQDDLTDAVHWAVKKGYADPTRLSIYGASYGGYAALAGVTLTPKLYRCAVNYAGPTDLDKTFLLPSWRNFPRGMNYQTRWVGKTKAYRDATSPVLLANRIRVPILNAYGKNDPVVNLKHWEEFRAKLRQLHKPYEIFAAAHEGHGFHRTGDRIAFHQMLVQFLAKNMKPKSEK